MSFNITFDYRFDSTGFFDAPERRASLEQAAAIWESILQDEFTDIAAGTRIVIDDPSASGTSREVILSEGIDDLLIFVGAEAISGSTLAYGGYESGGIDVGDAARLRIDDDFRGQGPSTDFEPYVGTISYRIDGNFSYDPAGPVAGQSDFLTVTLHEIAHVLGIGTAPIFDQIGAGGLFDGPNALAVNGGNPVPLESDLAHVEEGYDNDEVVLDPTITRGERLLPSEIDKALLADIGWEIAGFTKQGQAFDVATEGGDVTIFGSNIGDLLDGLGGNDQIQGNDGNDTLLGGDGNDTLFGQSGDDDLSGGADDDQVQGGVGSDTLRGGLGDDSLFGQNDGDEIDGGGGNDFVSGGGGVDTIIGGEGTDNLNGGADVDQFRILAGGGTATIQDFDLGSEVIELVGSGFATTAAVVAAITKPFSNVSQVTFENGTALRVFHASQSGTPLSAKHFSLVSGSSGPTEGNDTLQGTEDADSIDLLAGNDIYDGLGGRDTIFGGADDDTIDGGAEGDDIDGGDGNDLLRGGDGNDTITDGLGDDSIEGGDGDDIWRQMSGTDTFNGGEGRDTVDIDLTGAANPGSFIVEMNFQTGDSGARGNPNLRDTYIDVEGFHFAGAFDVDVLGDVEQNDIRTGAGADTINGWAGDDTIDGGTGADLLIGGQGSDIIYVDNTGDRVSESRKWAGTDTVISSVDFRMGRKHIENLELTGEARLGAGNGLMNIIIGNDADNTLDGGKNVDRLVGGLGNDTYLIRAPGDEAIEGTDGGIDTVKAFRAHALEENVERLFLQTLRNDAGEGVAGINGIGNDLDNLIVGNPFDNVIAGREGKDTLKGQAGADTFVFDRAIGPDNVDRIIDFNATGAGEGDLLKFKQSEFQGVVKGTLAETAFVAGTAAADAADRFIFDQASGQLWFDIDGTGAAAQQLVATFEQNALVTAADIELF